MKLSSKRVKTPSTLLDLFRKNLDVYSLAAGAAGLGIFASASPAQARVVFTPAHVVITPDHTFLLDLNHDGINDFKFQDASIGVVVGPLHGGALIKGAAACSFGKGAAALHAGAVIGNTRPFQASATCMASFNLDASASFGSWIGGVTNRFLGLQFEINGQKHFGWARLSVSREPYTATLTGYAYETVPNKAIIAGKTSDSAEIAAGQQSPATPGNADPEPATLGLLALGAARPNLRRLAGVSGTGACCRNPEP
jgi:hypothetical protein